LTSQDDRSNTSPMKKTSTKEKIIDASYNLMVEKGYNNTGLKEILTRAGVPKGSFYHFFENKEKLGLEVLEYYASNMEYVINENLLDKNTTAIQRLKNFFNTIIKILEIGE